MFKKKEEIKTWDMTYELSPNPEELEEMFDWNWYPIKINIAMNMIKFSFLLMLLVYISDIENPESFKKVQELQKTLQELDYIN